MSTLKKLSWPCVSFCVTLNSTSFPIIPTMVNEWTNKWMNVSERIPNGKRGIPLNESAAKGASAIDLRRAGLKGSMVAAKSRTPSDRFDKTVRKQMKARCIRLAWAQGQAQAQGWRTEKRTFTLNSGCNVARAGSAIVPRSNRVMGSDGGEGVGAGGEGRRLPPGSWGGYPQGVGAEREKRGGYWQIWGGQMLNMQMSNRIVGCWIGPLICICTMGSPFPLRSRGHMGSPRVSWGPLGEQTRQLCVSEGVNLN